MKLGVMRVRQTRTIEASTAEEFEIKMGDLLEEVGETDMPLIHFSSSPGHFAALVLFVGDDLVTVAEE